MIYTSWGDYVDVETAQGTYKEVILCPSNVEGVHLLESYNGDCIKVATSDMISIQRDGQEKYIIKHEINMGNGGMKK